MTADALAALNRELAEAMGWHDSGDKQDGATLWETPAGDEIQQPDYAQSIDELAAVIKHIAAEEPSWAYRVEYDPIAEMWLATWVRPYSHGFTVMLLYAERAVAEARAALAALRAMKEAT